MAYRLFYLLAETKSSLETMLGFFQLRLQFMKWLHTKEQLPHLYQQWPNVSPRAHNNPINAIFET